ncbi:MULTISPECIES: KpsF/GutQ family sugar-phosphate isomerase [Thalassolituus]|jgi:arabinose-5-phosphate isomerase|uniref:KpsF/GutQ family sugar-phosphate isomerase n=1 Tax=Thalassolituus TaxID=187492 RepID=UPI00042DC7D0|nr:KpsF/GutQ family sugar-phosphate isomerase [Thalassolituus oleivorans]PCI48371.1 MAG: KpsF/GutQ family sugar-phosphate isomerase [Oceanospirillales bacterium]PHQ87732.1 MAG: KpsF/GutQ family sugar-phosphate isomerase [Thalassobium sp.]AHK14889.1 D-arabinose 5-phosphate isomerase [Thalassolituus oleivorans R6-15]MCA6128069.1 D-arabinose 5-phosphate isomerase [Thalassolituus oleivorans 4BN06-13]MDF1640983.1 KpsF/GutQ family sugar-phosphate isomerase [Thalassolituus oleivorans]
MTTAQLFNFISSAERTIKLEQQAVARLADYLDEHFTRACQMIIQCRGRVVVTGMGKSGHIGNKIAATLASTGTPAFFVHPGEASHGDMGMITAADVVIALSNSGETNEVTSMLPLLKRMGTPLISMTGNPSSTLAKAANSHLYTGVEQEACPLDLAPTSSTTAALVMGDALAIALLEAKGFTAEDFAFSHPGGSLGRRLLLKVEDIMHSGDQLPVVNTSTRLSEALLVVTSKGLGMTTVQDDNGNLAGIFTDGDLRRAIDQGVDIRACSMSDIMTANCKTTTQGILAAEALKIMEDNKINALVVKDEQRTVGVVTMHDMLRAGVI